MRGYQYYLYEYISNGIWDQMSLKANQVSYILSLGFLPCEICLRLYAADAYDKVEPGKELDHIEPVNPENALNRIVTGATAVGSKSDIIEIKHSFLYGDPFDFDNLQYLCKRHHAKKSQREKR